MNDLFQNASHDVSDINMVCIAIQNQVNQNYKPIGIRIRRKISNPDTCYGLSLKKTLIQMLNSTPWTF